MDNKETHFGYKTVPKDKKAYYVKDVFDSVSSRYDLMNDLMSMGMHSCLLYTSDAADE